MPKKIANEDLIGSGSDNDEPDEKLSKSDLKFLAKEDKVDDFNDEEEYNANENDDSGSSFSDTLVDDAEEMETEPISKRPVKKQKIQNVRTMEYSTPKVEPAVSNPQATVPITCKYCHLNSQNCNCSAQNCRGCGFQSCHCNARRTMQMHHALNQPVTKKNKDCIVM